ncbi:MAG TPA: hypothetical protein VFV71_02520 [Burkholderiales bacterium]|nr:hypothetical protein [Burkholderiales bacterium]
MRTVRRSYPLQAPAARQSGVVLIIALIVLVSMTLAAIGMSRSVDTANVVAGNLGFKQSSVNATDAGIEAGYQWLLGNAGTATLNSTSLQNGYYSSTTYDEPDWTLSATWADAALVNGGTPDAAGNVVSYVIHRMCTEPNTAYNANNTTTGNPNQCAQSQSVGAATSGGSMSVGSTVFQGNPQIFYRITARAQGPHNTVSYVQSMVAITN